MTWRTTISAAVVLGAVMSAPLAAQTAATPAVPAMEAADSTWPVIVPRLTFTVTQKASINEILQQYCTAAEAPSRTEMQDRIRALLMPAQEVDALRYWIQQDLKRDLRTMRSDLTNGRAGASENLDACGRPEKAPA